MLPFAGNLTAALIALNVAHLAQKDHVVTDPSLVAVYDKVFLVSQTLPCYIGRCANDTRTLYSKKELKHMLLFKQPRQFGVNIDTLHPRLQAYFVSCRGALVDLFQLSESMRLNAELTRWTSELAQRCGVSEDIENAIKSHKAVEDVETVLSFRITHLLEDIEMFKVAAETTLLSSAIPDGSGGFGGGGR